MIIKNRKICIIDFGIGNLRSLKNCIDNLDFNVQIINKPKNLKKYNKIILPGVGSFKDAMNLIKLLGWDHEILENVLIKKKEILGICLGMQILLSKGHEFGITNGLNLISGEVYNLKTLGCNKLIPHIGWNEINIKKNDILFKNIPNYSSFYFVNSYACKLKNKSQELSFTNHDINFSSAIKNQNIYGTQFHPEKSSKAGRQLLYNFINA